MTHSAIRPSGPWALWSRQGSLDGPSPMDANQYAYGVDSSAHSPIVGAQCLAVQGEHAVGVNCSLHEIPVGSSYRNSQHKFNRPAKFEAIKDDVFRQACLLGPLNNAHRFAVEREASVVATVALLFFVYYPAAILWAVAEVVVSSIKRVLVGWTRAHVRVEVLETEPPLAHGDAAASVIAPGMVRFCAATAKHIAPHSVFFRKRLSVRDSGASIDRALLALETATTSSGSSAKSVTDYICDFAADATAHPKNLLFLSSSGAADDSEPTKNLACQVWMSRRRRWYSAVSHAVSSLQGDVLVRGLGSLSTILGSAYSTPRTDGVFA